MVSPSAIPIKAERIKYIKESPGVCHNAWIPGEKGIIPHKKREAAKQRRRFKVLGSNFPATDFVSVLLNAQQNAHPKALISPIKGSPFFTEFYNHKNEEDKRRRGWRLIILERNRTLLFTCRSDLLILTLHLVVPTGIEPVFSA